MVSDEIRAAQAAYAARPFAVCWRDSEYSGTSRFHTFDEAFEYTQNMWTMIRRRVAQRRHVESFLSQSYLETPEGRVQLRYWLLADDVSSY